MRNRRRFTTEFKAQVVLDVQSGQRSPAEARRSRGLRPNRLSTWKAHFLRQAHTRFPPNEPREGDQARIAAQVYDRKRIHSSLGDLTPSKIEQQWIITYGLE